MNVNGFTQSDTQKYIKNFDVVSNSGNWNTDIIDLKQPLNAQFRELNKQKEMDYFEKEQLFNKEIEKIIEKSNKELDEVHALADAYNRFIESVFPFIAIKSPEIATSIIKLTSEINSLLKFLPQKLDSKNFEIGKPEEIAEEDIPQEIKEKLMTEELKIDKPKDVAEYDILPATTENKENFKPIDLETTNLTSEEEIDNGDILL